MFLLSVEEAKQMFDLMASKDCYPNVVTYTTLINGFCKSKRVESGMALFSRDISKRIGWQHHHLQHPYPRFLSSWRL